jgi:type IV secretory pathway VirB10-like protein
MPSSARIFFAGVGTTFVILAVGFGGGLMLAKTAVYDSPAPARANSPPPPARMVLPTSAEPALQVTSTVTTPAPEPVPPAVQTAVEQPIVNEDRRREEGAKAEREKELRAERRRSAERKAKRIAAARARQLIELQRPQPGIIAFGGDEWRPQGFFGN